MDAYDLLWEAIRRRRNIVATYKGSRQRFWPYGIDDCRSLHPAVCVYEFAEDGREGSWSCLPVADLFYVVLTEDEAKSPDFSAASNAIDAEDDRRFD